MILMRRTLVQPFEALLNGVDIICAWLGSGVCAPVKRSSAGAWRGAIPCGVRLGGAPGAPVQETGAQTRGLVTGRRRSVR